eukprot:CFRG2600T1
MGPKSRRQIAAKSGMIPPSVVLDKTESEEGSDNAPELVAVEWEKDEFMDFLLYARISLALVCGLVFGGIGWMGSAPLAIYLVLSLVLGLGLPMIYTLDAHDFGGETSFMNEGVAPALCVFFALWVITYNIFQVAE